jgi:hypothetical protein
MNASFEKLFSALAELSTASVDDFAKAYRARRPDSEDADIRLWFRCAFLLAKVDQFRCPSGEEVEWMRRQAELVRKALDEIDPIPDSWLAAFERAEELDPIIREALRPVFDRLSKDAPGQASTLAMAMICRALRMIEPPPGFDRDSMRMRLAEMCAAFVVARPDHP